MTPSFDLAACWNGSWQATPDMGLRMLIGAGLMALAGWAGAHRVFPGQRAFVALCVSMTAWIGFSITEHAAVEVGCKGTVALASWLAILSQPPLWVLFLYQYLHSDTRGPSMRVRTLFAAPMVLMMALALTNGWHGLWYGPRSALGAPIAGLPRLHYDYGPMFYVAVTMGYAWIGLALVFTVRGWMGQSSRAQGAPRAPWAAFLAIMLLPVAVNLAYLAFGVRLWGVDPTSTAFAVALGAFSWQIRNNRIFSLVPLARRLLFTELPDPVLIVDLDGRVVEANVAAQQLAAATPSFGSPLVRWPRVGVALDRHLAAAEPGALLELHDPVAFYEVQRRELGDPDRRIGALIQLHDVTARQLAMTQVVEDLAARDAELNEAAAMQVFLREQAMRDPLTGLLNRRALDERFAQEHGYATSSGQSLALVLVDVDHFKRINDSHGHAVGDAVLRDFSAALRTGLRASDTVFRVGGEEFALLLPGADAPQAARRAQALRERVAGRKLGNLVDAVTFSAGVACIEDHGQTLDEMMAAADKALYQAKNQGRNRTVVAPLG